MKHALLFIGAGLILVSIFAPAKFAPEGFLIFSALRSTDERRAMRAIERGPGAMRLNLAVAVRTHPRPAKSCCKNACWVIGTRLEVLHKPPNTNP